ncbi:MAG: DUF58 domain-containing protein [Myxococcota bacterium]|jgi:uncharacterized protein (DUF58 family)|nr:DUF58 domain-containing protein [Myxococcota bacterium]
MSSVAPPRQPLTPETQARLQGLLLEAREAVEGVLSGLHRSRHRGASIEFQEHKEYSPGDELRHIDWKANARNDRLWVKQFEQETNLRALLLLDASASMGYGSHRATKLDRACEIAATLAHLLLRQQDAVGLVAFQQQVTDYIPPRSSSGHLTVLLEKLAGLQAAGQTDLVQLLGRVAELADRRGMVILLSDLFDLRPEVVQRLRQLRGRKHEVIVLQLLDPWELTFPFSELTRFVDLEEPRTVQADPRGMRRAYLEELRSYLEGIRRACQEADIDYLLADTARSPGEVLTELLARRQGR